ncbi:hypothetical protein B9N43_00245 [Denitratisoma sp. DHT3]|uniref:DUF2863 family protein n=1 Tax=Denitratisoma sp. DHT3 TaxID=1981880 RepID=UPI001198AE17|nr:DUF2863 family protein [Denitratisoma sp. DHT3]QDX79833.1 hypothetical protein B9N43_00245 [Denitratisoma sp. DHT3]
MKRSRFSRRSKHTPDVETLCRLAQALGLSSSRIEDAFWEARLIVLIDKLLNADDEAALNAALDHLYQTGERGYDNLADLIESRGESRPAESDGEFDILLIAAPVLSWSRYSIPSGPLPKEVLTDLKTHLQAHILADHARLALADALFSPDQLPQSYCDTLHLTQRLGRSAVQARNEHFDPADLAETMNFLSDTRYLLGAVAVPKGGAVFRWQEADGNREGAIRHWQLQGGEALKPALPACAIELLAPSAYHAACRDADRQSRPHALRAALAFLHATLNVTADQLRAVIAPFHDQRLEEYRVGLTLAASNQVIHGVVWPLLEAEDEASDIPGQIEAVLKEAGVRQIMLLDHRFPLEYCDDCGAPLYPNPEGEPMHAEVPEGHGTEPPRHLH